MNNHPNSEKGLYSENKSTAQKGAVFKMGKVNIDALIPREDFEYKEEEEYIGFLSFGMNFLLTLAY